MSLMEYLRTTNNPIRSFVNRKVEIVESTNPQCFYVENIRSFLGVSHRVASVVCKAAVRRGLFERRVGVLCPVHRQIIKDFADGEVISGPVSCRICEMLGDEISYDSNDLDKIEFFRTH